MGSKLVKKPIPKSGDKDIPLLLQMIYDFAETADLVEKYVVHRKLDPDTRKDVEPWMSMKAVSHFNLATALELLLKLLLIRSGREFPHTHEFHMLYSALPEQVQTSIQDTYREIAGSGTLTLRAMMTAARAPRHRPRNRPIATLQDMLKYFDEDMKLSEKRYTWEPKQKQQWRLFIDNPSIFVKWIHRIRNEQTEQFNQEQASP